MKILEDISVPLFKGTPEVEIYLFGASGLDSDLMPIRDSRLHLIDLPKTFSNSQSPNFESPGTKKEFPAGQGIPVLAWMVSLT